jgi:GAF domain-containing protein
MSGPKRFIEWLIKTQAQTAVEKNRGRILAIFLVLLIMAGLVFTIIHIILLITEVQTNLGSSWPMDLVGVGLLIGLWALNRSGFTGIAGAILVLCFIAFASLAYKPTDLGQNIVYYTIPILLAAFIVQPRYTFIFTLIAVAHYSFVTFTASPGVGFNYVAILILFIFSITLWRGASRMESLVKESEGIAISQTEANRELTGSKTALEQQGERQSRNLERRSRQLQVITDITRDLSISQNVDEMLNHAARLIREQLGFYHVGIFLVDENNEYAVIRAAGGDAGQLMVVNNHKTKVGEEGPVGLVAATGEIRIAQDVGVDTTYTQNPLLPYTRSEITLPLKTGVRILGVLDAQSDRVNAIDQEDATTLQSVADQLAVAIEKTRLSQSLGQTTDDMDRMSQQYTGRTWKTYLQRGQRTRGYRYEGATTEPLDAPPSGSQEALKKGVTTVTKAKGHSILSVPIKLRGQTLGVLNLRYGGSDIPKEALAFVEEAANRLALALENARLLEDAQYLATREKQINIITSRAQQSTDLDIILQSTIRELGTTLGVPRAFIQIGLSEPEEELN